MSYEDIRAGLEQRQAATQKEKGWSQAAHDAAAQVRKDLKGTVPDAELETLATRAALKAEGLLSLGGTLLPPEKGDENSHDLIKQGLIDRGILHKSAAERQGRSHGQEGKRQGASIP